ncbi:disulfide oxidoreductase [Longirhabdus pacifica]|uniref:disulfide oxidoreductase n=1 Tax=Longirhabdus pacifica TaxID=2305227 RepID=UPI001F0C60BA|nr:disulfide oxidoreductase [Longirhabdus pacifica]
MNWRYFALYGAWIISVIATGGSLYFSEVLGYMPCQLCWYQRILMYPLVVILGIAAYESNFNIKKYVLPLSILGFGIGVFHYLEQKVPGFAEIKPCTNGIPCNLEYINWFGFITIPFLSLVAFFLISVLLILSKSK